VSAIEFEEWTAPFVHEDVVIEDVLWVRATKGDEQYATPVFEADDRKIADAKMLLIRKFDSV